MKTVWKFSLAITDHQKVTMPKGAQLLHVALQNPHVTQSVDLWALVDPNADTAQRQFAIHGTGHDIEHDWPYVGTVLAMGGALVWHVFDGGEM